MFRTAHDVFMQLQAARAKLTDSRERPSGDLKITTPPALGINWLIPRLDEFTALYPDIRISLIVTDEDLDLSMREADVAIRTRKPTQPDLIQRKLFSIGFHAYCSPEYIKRFGTPRTLDDLDSHRIIMLGDAQVPPHLQNRSWLIDAGRNGSGPREAFFKVNNILGLVRACQQGLGIAALPDYLVEENNRLVQLFGETDSIQVDTYFVYPEELKTVARVQVFRDFVVSKAQRWPSEQPVDVSEPMPRLRISRSYKGPGLRMSDMRLGRLMQGADGDHSACTLSDRVAHMSPSSSGAGAQ